jgi:beta-lactam-binding protein with PASTA domain
VIGEITYEASEKPLGTIISQSVKANTSLPEKSKISFTLSGGINY